MLAYAFVLVNNRVCVFKYTPERLVFVCLKDLSPAFWADFIEIYNIPKNVPKDFVFVWDKPQSFLDNPYFIKQLNSSSVWGQECMSNLLDVLHTEHHLSVSLLDSLKRELKGGTLVLHTNANLAPEQRRGRAGTPNVDMSDWQEYQERLTEEYEKQRGQKREPEPLKARETPTKMQTPGGDKAPQGGDSNR
ncbi:hypothetical protein [Helicobacter suis]|uniref:hypothetical protein n=1 Tax=Helicobacter suis TaxID=104628 RepID=UPI0013D4AB31|nr:hypothetical protein [Helicobacter suis]